jgi:hypothetical protein
MGIIRNILLFLFLIHCLNIQGQTIRDTVEFNGELYIKHIVKGGESLNKIAKLHNVKVADILESNEMSKRLYYHQLLYIPVNPNNSSKQKKKVNSQQIEVESKYSDKSKINLALLMPYYLIKNDTMFNDFKDRSKISSIYYNSSEAALSFHIGVTLALDSLRKTEKNIILHTFDTNKDTIKTHKLVMSKVLDKMDIIIGPLYAKNFNILCKKYGNDKEKIIINPLSKITKSVKKYKSVHQISPSVKDQSVLIKNRIIKKYKNKRVVLLHQTKDKAIALFIQNLFRKEKKNIKLFDIQYSHVDSFRNIFTDFQIVIIPSTNRAFVSKLLTSIGRIDSTSIIYGLDAWKRYDNLDIENLMELDVHIPVANAFSYKKKHDKAFLKFFESKYNTNQAKYTHIAYNIIMHFCSDFTVFQFKRKSGGGKVNIRAPLFHYKDYELIPLR